MRLYISIASYFTGRPGFSLFESLPNGSMKNKKNDQREFLDRGDIGIFTGGDRRDGDSGMCAK